MKCHNKSHQVSWWTCQQLGISLSRKNKKIICFPSIMTNFTEAITPWKYFYSSHILVRCLLCLSCLKYGNVLHLGFQLLYAKNFCHFSTVPFQYSATTYTCTVFPFSLYIQLDLLKRTENQNIKNLVCAFNFKQTWMLLSMAFQAIHHYRCHLELDCSPLCFQCVSFLWKKPDWQPWKLKSLCLSSGCNSAVNDSTNILSASSICLKCERR